MSISILFYFAPFVPLLIRAVLVVYWHSKMNDYLPEEALERDSYRTYILSLAGFSFTAVAAFSVLESQYEGKFQYPTWCAIISFVTFMFALNMQGYKAARWQAQFAVAFIEVGTLSLMLILISLVWGSSFDFYFKSATVAIVLITYTFDLGIRMRLDHSHLKHKKEKKEKQNESEESKFCEACGRGKDIGEGAGN